MLTRVQDVHFVEALVLIVAAEDDHQASDHGGAVVRPGGRVGAVNGGVAPVPALRVEDGHVVLPLSVCVWRFVANSAENRKKGRRRRQRRQQPAEGKGVKTENISPYEDGDITYSEPSVSLDRVWRCPSLRGVCHQK